MSQTMRHRHLPLVGLVLSILCAARPTGAQEMTPAYPFPQLPPERKGTFRRTRSPRRLSERRGIDRNISTHRLALKSV